MQVKELIVTPVASCLTSTDVGSARDLMTLKKISALPVVDVVDDQAKLKGIVSIFDLAGVYDDTINIKQVMSKDIHAIAPDASIQEAAEMMIEHKIHHLIAMEGEKIVGIISSFDFVKLVADSKG